MKTIHTAPVLVMLYVMTGFFQMGYAQGQLSLSGGTDFASLQLLLDGKITPVYDNETVSIGAATPFSLTLNYTFDPFLSTAVNNQGTEQNLNALLTLAAAGYLTYAVADDFAIKGMVGYGTAVNSEPWGVTIDENGQPTNEPFDYLGYGLFLDLSANYKKIGLKFTNLGDLNQLFATYNVTNKFFLGLGYREINRVYLSKANGTPQVPSKFQATLGINWNRIK